MAAANLDLKDNIGNIYAIVAAIICVGAAYMFYDQVWIVFKANETKLLAEQKREEEKLDKIRKRKPEKHTLESKLQRAEIELNRLREMFPEEEKVPRRLQDLQRVIRESGVNIQSFKPSDAPHRNPDGYIENKYSFNINAGYHMLGYMFAEIANLNYPTKVNNLKLSQYSAIAQELKKHEDSGRDPITMAVSFDLTTFTSLRSR